jgi:hypothetical protein
MRSNQLHPVHPPLTEWGPVPPALEAVASGLQPPARSPGPRPRGCPLTELMPLRGPDGTEWVAYIEGVPPEPAGLLGRRAVLPGRRLRFDSAGESRTTGQVPAGAPFLAAARLVQLLAASSPFPPPAAPARPSARVRLRRWVGHDLRPRARRLYRRIVGEVGSWGPRWERLRMQVHHGLAVLLGEARRVFR